MSNLLDKASILLTPTAYNNGSMLSVKPTDGDGDFTFVRGSAATRVNAQGLVENVQIISSELVTNGDFSNGSTGWTLGSQWSIVNETAVLVGDGSFSSLEYPIAFESGKTYRVEFDVIAISGNGKLQIQQGALTEFSTTGSHSYDVTVTNTPNSNIQFARKNGSVNMTLDNISVKEITDDTNLPRINYEGFSYDGNGDIIPNSGCGSWLLENQSTNLVTQSNQLTAISGGIVTANAAISPDGTLNAIKVNFSTGSNSGGVISVGGISAAASTEYTFSFYAKNFSGDGTFRLRIDTDTQAVVASETFTATSKWVRYTKTFTTDAAASSFSSGSRFRKSTTSDNNEVLFFGMQLEKELSYATSYIPTEGAANTRNQDIATNSGNSTLINSTEGVLYVEIARDSNDGNVGGIQINDGTVNNGLRLFFNQTDTISVITRVGGSNNVVKTAQAITSSTAMNKFALKWKLNDYKLYYNGVELWSDTSASVYPIGTLNVIDFKNQNLPFQGKNKCLAVYKEALTDAELQCLTTP